MSKDTARPENDGSETLSQVILEEFEKEKSPEARVVLIKVANRRAPFDSGTLFRLFDKEQVASVKIALVEAMGNEEDFEIDTFLSRICEIHKSGEGEEVIACSLARCLRSKIPQLFSEKARKRDYSPQYTYVSYIKSRAHKILNKILAINNKEVTDILAGCIIDIIDKLDVPGGDKPKSE